MIISLDEDEIDLAEAVLLIAAEEYPNLDIRAYIEKLDRFGALAVERATGERDIRGVISSINSTLFETLEFHGCRDTYYDPRNSFLNQVIDRRTGLPITLSVVYIEVARRIGLTIHGVGLPYHFVTKVETETGELFIDPFNEGHLLTAADCAALVIELSRGNAELLPEHLEVVNKKRVLGRILLNLLGLYKANDPRRALAALDRLLLITPDNAHYMRMRGLMLAKAGDQKNAIAQLERYLEANPEPDDSEEIREQINTIRSSLVRLN